MIWHGDADYIFPVNLTMNTWNGIFDILQIRSTLKIAHTEPGMTHTFIKPEFDQIDGQVHSRRPLVLPLAAAVVRSAQ